MPISDVRHQPAAQAMVRHALASGRLAHGLLLAGPEGVGREMFAGRLAALLLCEGRAAGGKNAAADACGACASCRLADAGTHPDIHLVYRELYRTIKELAKRQGLELYIDVIRQYVISAAALKSARGRGKVFIVRDAHLMSDEAQNALLKTLEEPPAGTTIMLVTDQAHRLLDTVRSRCQLLRFDPLPSEFVIERLTGATVGEGAGRPIDGREAAYLAARSGGRLGQALRLAEADLFALHEELARRLADLTPANAVDLADWLEEQVNTLAKERTAREEGLTDSQAKKECAGELLATAAMVLSDALRVGAGAAGEGEAMFSQLAARLAGGQPTPDRLEGLADAIAAVTRADYLIATRFINPRLALDEAAVTLAERLSEAP